MKFVKKLTAVLCAAAMCSVMFVGCGSKSEPTASTAEPATPSSETVEETKEIVNIVWYVMGNSPAKTDEVVKALNEKSAADIGVTVDFQFQGSDETALLNALATGDSTVDIVGSSTGFGKYLENASKGYYLDLTDKLPEVASELNEFVPETLWDGVKVDGRIYGVPTWKDTTEHVFWIGEKETLENLGVADQFLKGTTKIGEMTPVLEVVRDWMLEDPENNISKKGESYALCVNKHGFWNITAPYDTMINKELEIGAKNFTAEHPTIQWLYEDPEYVEQLKTLKMWADTGISNGLVAAQRDTINWGVITPATGWDGAQYTVWGGPALGFDTILAEFAGPNLKSTAALGSVNSIPANSKNADATLKYLEYINTNADYRNMLAYGIPGVNYEEVDGKCKILNSDWVAPNYAMASFYHMLAPEQVPNADMYKVICDGVNTAPHNSLMGFMPDLSEIQNEVAACSSIIPEYAYPLHCGNVDDVDAAIAEYKAELDKMGLQIIIDELQRQVDEFIASK